MKNILVTIFFIFTNGASAKDFLELHTSTNHGYEVLQNCNTKLAYLDKNFQDVDGNTRLEWVYTNHTKASNQEILVKVILVEEDSRYMISHINITALNGSIVRKVYYEGSEYLEMEDILKHPLEEVSDEYEVAEKAVLNPPEESIWKHLKVGSLALFSARKKVVDFTNLSYDEVSIATDDELVKVTIKTNELVQNFSFDPVLQYALTERGYHSISKPGIKDEAKAEVKAEYSEFTFCGQTLLLPTYTVRYGNAVMNEKKITSKREMLLIEAEEVEFPILQYGLSWLPEINFNPIFDAIALMDTEVKQKLEELRNLDSEQHDGIRSIHR